MLQSKEQIQKSFTSQGKEELILCGFDRGDKPTLGILQYCVSAASGIVYQIDELGNFSTLSGQTVFSDGVTALADRTVAQLPAHGETFFSYWFRGSLVRVSTMKTFQHDDVSGVQYFAYGADGNMISTHAHEDLIVHEVLCILINYNATTKKKIIFADERHGDELGGYEHFMQHITTGARWHRGLLIDGLVDNATTFSRITEGAFLDEDIVHTLPEILTCPFAYRDINGDWEITDTVDNKLAYQVGGKTVYNEWDGANWKLTNIGSDYFVVSAYATNDAEHRIFKVIGQTLYPDRKTARRQFQSAAFQIEDKGLPTTEFINLGCWIMHGQNNFSLEKGAIGEIWMDLRREFPVDMF